jgi:outer membrane protein TolC
MRRQAAELITLEVTQGRLAVARAEQRVAAAGRAVASARENLRVTQDRFQEKVATSVEVLDAETLLRQARTAEVQAWTDLAVARARLMKALGE